MSSSSLKRFAPWIAVVVAVGLVALYFFLTRPKPVAPAPVAVPSASAAPVVAKAAPQRSAPPLPVTPPPTGTVDLTVATLEPRGFVELPQLAQGKGYFDAEGLRVQIDRLKSGGEVARAVSEGKAAIGLTFDFSIAFGAFGKPGFVVLAEVAHAVQPMTVFARKDRSIARAEDLKGKRVGIQGFPNSRYFLGLYLKRHGLAEADLTVVEMNHDQLQGALTRGEIDALADGIASLRGSGWKLLKTPGADLVDLTEPGVCPIRLGLIARAELVKSKPEALERFTRAIVKATAFLNQSRDEAVDEIARGVAAEGGPVRKLTEALSYEVSLEPSFVASIEAAGRWFQESGRNKAGTFPDFAHLVYADALRKVQPSVVTVPN